MHRQVSQVSKVVMQPLFMMVAGDTGCKSVPLYKDAEEPVYLGRNAATGITDPNVSRKHAAVVVKDGTVILTPTGVNTPMIVRKNGEVVCCKKAQEEVLNPLDLVYLLHTIKYRYTLMEYSTDASDDKQEEPTLHTQPMPVVQQDNEEVANEQLTSFFKFSAVPCPHEEEEGSQQQPTLKKTKVEPVVGRPEDDRPLCPDGKLCQHHSRIHFTEYRHSHLPTLASEIDMADECSEEDQDEEKAAKLGKTNNNSQTQPLVDSDDSDAGGALPPCPYGSNCYRKNPLHLKQYSHKQRKQQKHNPQPGVDSRPMCPYGSKCYRQNVHHQKMYYHPPPKIPIAAPSPTSPPTGGPTPPPPTTTTTTTDVDTTAPQSLCGKIIAPPADLDPKAPKPKNWLADGDLYLVGTGAAQYKLKNAGGVWYCTCAAWRYQQKGPDERNCKHLEDFLGLGFNNWRIKQAQGGDDADTDMPETGTTTASAPPVGGGIKKTQVPRVLLAQKWEEKTDPTGWLLSEKLDGVRAWWDGEQFVSRLGNVYHAPPYFAKEMPRGKVLDGELFGGRKRFQFTVGVVKSSAKSALWKQLTYQVFDVPELQKPFEERLEWLHENLGESKNLEFVRVVEHKKCKGKQHLAEELKAVEKEGGEGLMLRQPRSQYVGARSGTLLKVKSHKDYEARVIAHEPGKGKYKGMTGALTCELPNGKKFSVGSGMTDKDRGSPPKIGDIICFRYTELTDSGIPRFPRYIGPRADAKWPPEAPWPP